MEQQNETAIQNHSELRDALTQLWIAESEYKIARTQAKEMAKQIMQPVKVFQDQIKMLQPKIQSYMLANDLPRVRTNGKEFILRSRKSKRKMDIKELCALFDQNNINDDLTRSTLQQANVLKTSHRIVIPTPKEEEDALVDL